MTTPPAPFLPPDRLLLGPGPSPADPAVLRAMARPPIGYMDPALMELMREIQDMLRAAFGTGNAWTWPMSTTGMGGMETCLVNLVEPGDRVLVGVNGVFGGRQAEIVRRIGAEAVTVEIDWGTAFTAEVLVDAARKAGGSFDLISAVHAETSTGALQPLGELRQAADELNALLLVDTVTSLAGVPVEIDNYGIDAAYSGTQKCLGVPPGLSPVTFSERARAIIEKRKGRLPSFYLDVEFLSRYWGGGKRAYHHTAPCNAWYGLHEGLRLTLEEGLENRYNRHRRNAELLWRGLEELGMTLLVDESIRLPQLTAVAVPEGVDDAEARTLLRERFGIEIGGGLGAMAGTSWRIGLMGAGSTERNVLTCLAALGEVLESLRAHR